MSETEKGIDALVEAKVKEELEARIPGEKYGYRGNRLAAAMVDGLIIMILAIPLYVVFGQNPLDAIGGEESVELMVMNQPIAYTILSYLMPFLYFTLMHSSKYQATLGKKLLGLYVVNKDGNRLSFQQSFIRYLAYAGIGILIAFLPPAIGFFVSFIYLIIILPILFRADRRGVHDMIAGSTVLKGRAL